MEIKIIRNNKEEGAIKDFMGIITAMCPIEEEKNETGEITVADIIKVTNENDTNEDMHNTILSIDESNVVEIMKHSCDILSLSEEEIKTIVAMLNSFDEKELKELEKDIDKHFTPAIRCTKFLFSYAIKRVIRGKKRRQILFEAGKQYWKILKTQYAKIKEEKQKELAEVQE